VSENPGEQSNERLEFLGDAVLGWVVADIAFRQFTELPEGALTDLRKSVVNATALAEVAQELRIGEALLLGKGEDAAGGREKPSILSDAFEAVLGAVYVDGGTQQAYDLIRRLIGPRLEAAVGRLDQLDHKSSLQEVAARNGYGVPEYTVRADGPDHAKRFYATVVLDGRIIGEGEGRSKKAAEQMAASEAFGTFAGG
jgi:ribonuclease-3